MPSTRRSQASPTVKRERHSSSSISLSPKATRSARPLPPPDPVERESTARSAKRRKTASPQPDEVLAEQNVKQSNSGSVSGNLSDTEPDANTDSDGPDQDDVSGDEEDGLEETTDDLDASPEPEAQAEHLDATPAQPVGPSDLDQLADQILNVKIQTTPKELATAINDAGSEIGQKYVQLQVQFAAAKSHYSGPTPFLSPADLGESTPRHTEICRRVNLVTWVLSLENGQVGLEELDNYFLFTFLPRGGTLSKLAASLWIELKTQAFIAAIVNRDPRPSVVVLSILFNEGVRQRLIDVRPGLEELAPSEEEFMHDMKSRREALENDLAKLDSKTLVQKYPWMNLLENVVSYISILKLEDHKLTGSERLLLKSRQDVKNRDADDESSHDSESNGSDSPHPIRTSGYLDTPEESFKHKLGRCALLAIQAQGLPYFTHDGPVPWPLIRHSAELQEDPPPGENSATSQEATATSPPPSIPHPSQTAPTLTLYAKAREASEIEALHPPQSPSTDEQNNNTATAQRRKWSLDEEHALLQGLDRAQGPHWSQILTEDAGGPLKGRTEAELKDKARSLKLFFLKAGIEVPFYLKEIDSKSGSVAISAKEEEEEDDDDDEGE